MLLRRITNHFQAQNWTAIGLDFVIVVVGVFIGIQVSNWNEHRVSRNAEREFIATIRSDIERDVANAQGFVEMLSLVIQHGHSALAAFNSDTTCKDDCWNELLHYFFASQWVDVRTNLATFDEIRRTGLPKDNDLKMTLTRYYGSTDQVTIIASELPRYRELVRSIIPATMQEHMWLNCIYIDGRQQILREDCAAPAPSEEVRAINEAIRTNAEIEPSLTFWISTIAIVSVGLNDQVAEGNKVIAIIDEYLADY